MTALMPTGVHTVPEADYHADKGSLSVSGAKRLLPPSCPAKFKWELDHGRAPKRAFDFGHAAHAEVLGIGAEVVVVKKVCKDKTVVDADDYTTKSAQEHRDAIYAEGKIPLLWHEAKRVRGMAEALRRHVIASALFLGPGKAEQSMYRIDPVTGVVLRSRTDWLPESDGGELRLVDYKSTLAADLRSVVRSTANFGYHMQDAWYTDTAVALELAVDASMVFLFQETQAPFLVTAVELDDEARAVGRARNRQAINLYAECMSTGIWPGYTDQIELIALAQWATTDLDMDVI